MTALDRRRGAALTLIVLAGALLRVALLGRVPGINGDEAWFGVNAFEIIDAGHPFLRTPSGNLLNPLHSVPLLAALTVIAPSLTILRAPAALWGIVCVAAMYPLLARPCGPRAALLATALCAVSPAAVSQSRLGWDPSGTPLVSLLAIAFAMRDRPFLAAAAQAAALIVHPTNVFLSPIVALAWGPHALSRYSALSRRTQRFIRALLVCAIFMAVGAGLPLARILAHRGLLPSVEIVAERLLTPPQWQSSTLGLVRLVSGVTSVQTIAGPLEPRAVMAADALTMVAIAVTLVIGVRSALAGRSRLVLWLAGGLAISAGTFHLVAGPAALSAGLERYAMFLVVPTLIVVALAVADVALTAPRLAWVGAAGACGAFTALLIGGYFVPLALDGRAGHDTYRTGPVEPKAAAFAFVEHQSHGAEVVQVLAENWWLYWPLRYLAHPAQDRLHVEQIEPETLPLRPPGVTPPPYRHRPDKVFAVVFAGGMQDIRLRQRGRLAYSALDARGQPILNVIELMPAATELVRRPLTMP